MPFLPLTKLLIHGLCEFSLALNHRRNDRAVDESQPKGFTSDKEVFSHSVTVC